MKLFNLSRTAAFALGAFVLSLAFTSSDALAKKDKNKNAGTDTAKELVIIPIEATGISSFDEVYNQAKALNDKLSASDANIKAANDGLCTALGVATGSPIDTAIADFKAKAPGMLTVTMDGTTPKVAAKPEAPENVTQAVDGINEAVKKLTETQSILMKIPEDAKLLVEKAKEFPATAPAAAKESGIKATEVPKLLKTVKNDTKSTLAIPGNAKILTENTVFTLKQIASLGG